MFGEVKLELKAKSSIEDMLTAACEVLPGKLCGEDFVAYQNDQILGRERLVIDLSRDPIHISKY